MVPVDALALTVGRLLRQRRATLALAESCTGGRIVASLTSVAGASEYVWGCAVVYTAEAKSALLGLDSVRLERDGTVSAETTAALAERMRELAGTTYGLAVTGWAGPVGGTATDPVGTVYLALACKRRVVTQRLRCVGDRETVIRLSTDAALDWLRRRMLGLPEELG